MRKSYQKSSYYAYGSLWNRKFHYYTLGEVIAHESYHAWEHIIKGISRPSRKAERRAISFTNIYRDCYGYPHR